MRIEFDRLAVRALLKHRNRAAQIREKIEQHARDPGSPAGNVSKLQGRNGYRLRVGDFRVIFEIEGDVLSVLDIGPRGDIDE